MSNKHRHALTAVMAVLLLFTLALPANADDNANATKKHGIIGFVRKIGDFIDTMAVSRIDRRYIEAPKRPWQLIVKGNTGKTDVRMSATLDFKDMIPSVPLNVGQWEWEPRIKSATAGQIGIWAGYRGYGLGYSVNLGHNPGSSFTIGTTGGSYGVSIRIHRFETDETTIKFTSDVDNEHYEYEASGQLDAPVKVNTVIANAYYVLNGKKFSYAAAYDQSVVQLRSAGSIVVGGMYYYSHMDYSSRDNALFMSMMNDIGRVKQWQVSLGAGYAYNFVPGKGWLISAMAMPQFTIHNRLKVWRYGSNLSDYYDELVDLVTDYDEGRITKEEYDSRSKEYADKVQVWERGVASHNSKVQLNMDTKLSVTYQWNRYFINAYGQFNTFRYGYGDTSGRLTDWYVNTSLGVRL